MKAIILAAGRGSRMKKMTLDKPKCLLELGGYSLLNWQIKALVRAGISSITAVRGYKKELISNESISYLENERWKNTNMVYTLYCAREILKTNTCLVSYSDIVYHPSIVEALMNSDGDISITYDIKWEELWKERFIDPLLDAESFETSQSYLKEIGEKPSNISEIQGQYMGLIKITPNGWLKIETFISLLNPMELDKLDMTSLFKALLKEGITIKTVPIQGKWCEVDREEDLRLYQKRLDFEDEWLHDWR